MEKKVYEKLYERENKFWWHDGMKKITTFFLATYLKNQKTNTILDVGCGTGGGLQMLAYYGKVFGIDVSDEAVLYARRRNIASIVKAEAEALPFNSSFFDLVTCFDVLYHRFVKDDTKALQEYSRVLKSGGLLLIREPAFNWLRGEHDRMVWTKHRYHKKELQAKIENAGLIILKISYVNFFLFPLVFISRLSERIFKKKESPENIFVILPGINFFFKKILYLEAKLLKYITFPFGSSVICIARKR